MGIYINVQYTNLKDNGAHKLVQMTCSVCGHVITGREIELRKINKCTHVYKNTTIKLIEIQNKKTKHVLIGMIRRCYNAEDPNYRWYGGKGVRICDEWLHKNSTFQDWYTAHTNGDNNLTIDRIDSDGDYCPSNCRMIPAEENSRWKSTTNSYEVNGTIKTGRQWADYLGVGTNKINRYARFYGEQAAIALIDSQLKEVS